MSYYNLISMMPKVSVPPPPFDPDAQAFITATGITDITQQNAINQLVLDLKSASIWTKMKAIYPIVGGTAFTHKFNLINPLDTNAAFRLSFNGGWTHGTTGATSNGINTYADTFANLSTDFTLYSAAYSYYIRNNTNIGIDIGVTQTSPYIYEGWSAARYAGYSLGGFYNNDEQGVKVASSDSTGFWISSITSIANTFLRRNDTTLGTTTASSSPANTTIYIGAVHQASPDSAIEFSNHEYSFASIGDGLTELESQLFYQITEKYQVALGRNINPTQSFYYNSAYNDETNVFLFNTQITDATIQTATNTLVSGLKTANIWTKMKAVYPMVGGTATTHKFNLVNAQNTNAAFRLQFFGGWTHSVNGALPNGVDAYADTFLIPNTIIASDNSTHLSFYSRTQILQPSVEIGSSDFNNFKEMSLFMSYLGTKGGTFYTYPSEGVSASNNNTLGFQIITRTSSSNLVLHFNSVKLSTNSNIKSQTTPSYSTVIGSNRTSTSILQYSSKECAFASIGDGLTDTEALDYYNIVQAFQQTLGRDV